MTKDISSDHHIAMTEDRFRTLIEKSTDAIQLVSAEGKILYTSESIINVLGYTAEELEGLGIGPFLHPDDLENFMTKFQELLANPGGQIILNYRVKHKDGSWAWLETVGVNHLNTPNINALVGNFRNITDRKNAEEKLKENEARLNLALEAGDIGVWDWDIATNKIRWTDKVYEIHETDRNAFDSEFVSYVTRIFPEDKERVQQAIKAALEEKAGYNIEFRILTEKGKVKWVSTRAKVLYDNDKPFRMLGATIDVSKRKELEKQKDEFLATASHELKTPVTSLKAYAQLLQMKFEKIGDTDSVGSLKKMNGQINKLTGLISDLLDVTKIQSGKLLLQKENFDLNELVNEIVDEMQLITKEHTLVKQLEKLKTTRIYADKERIGQVITNLISNAIKYCPKANEILIKTNFIEDAIQLSVKDYGIGIAQDHQEKIFEEFYRVSDNMQNTFPGLGLGLYIACGIIQRHNGKLWVESKQDAGSTFYFSIPIE